MIAAIIGGILVLVLVAFGLAIALLSSDDSKNGVAQPAPKTTATSAAASAPSRASSASVTASPTATPTVNKLKAAQAAALTSLGNLVGQSGSARSGIGGALSDIGSCKNIPQAVATLKRAAVARQNLAAQASTLNLGAIPSGAQLILAFRNSMQQSALTDQQYALWGQQVSSCKKKAPSTKAQKDAVVYDGQATAAKTDFANKYNAVAVTLGLPGTSAASF